MSVAGAKLNQPLPLDGRDLGPLLRDGVAPDRDALLLVGTQPNRAAVRMGDWKLLVRASDIGASDDDDDPDDGKAAKPGSDAGELYNLADDPGEHRDLARTQPDRVRTMRTRLDQLMVDAVKPVSNRP